MKKTYQKPYIDVLYVDTESLLAGSERTTDGNGPTGSVSEKIEDLDSDASAKGGSFWDDWDSGDTWEE